MNRFRCYSWLNIWIYIFQSNSSFYFSNESSYSTIFPRTPGNYIGPWGTSIHGWESQRKIYGLPLLLDLLLWLYPNTKWHSSLKISFSSEYIPLSQDTPQGNDGCRAWYKERLCVLQTQVLRDSVADIIPISWCPFGGVETSVIYLHNDCIHLCDNALSWAAATDQITWAVIQSHSWNHSWIHRIICTSPMSIEHIIYTHSKILIFIYVIF